MEKGKGGSYKRCSDNIKIPGFTAKDTYPLVVRKAALSFLGEIDERICKSCSLILGNGRILDAPLQNKKPWILGEFSREIGAFQKLSRMVIGIHIPVSKPVSYFVLSHSLCYSQMWKVVMMRMMPKKNVSKIINLCMLLISCWVHNARPTWRCTEKEYLQKRE